MESPTLWVPLLLLLPPAAAASPSSTTSTRSDSVPPRPAPDSRSSSPPSRPGSSPTTRTTTPTACSGPGSGSECGSISGRTKGGYAVPRGGWFELISCPNYFGEILEWLGWAVMTWSWAGLEFLLYTCANLFPRARANQAWYLEEFGEGYPKSRKAVIPFLF